MKFARLLLVASVVMAMTTGVAYGASPSPPWVRQSVQLPKGAADRQIESLSCATTHFCIAVGVNYEPDTHPVAFGWNGRRLSVEHLPVPKGQTGELNGISCPTSKFCVAVGYLERGNSSTRPYLLSWNGVTWHARQVPSIPDAKDGVQLYSVSCPAVNFCMAVGEAFHPERFPQNAPGTFSRSLAIVWNGSEWVRRILPQPPNASYVSPSSISCPNASFCEAVGQTSYIYGTADGTGQCCGFPANGNHALAMVYQKATGWQLIKVASPKTRNNALFSVSCVSQTFCMSVGLYDFKKTTKALLNEWNGKANSVVLDPFGPATSSSYAVSCPTEVTCALTGLNGEYAKTAIEQDGKWLLQAAHPASDGIAFQNLSCVADGCVAVGDTGLIDRHDRFRLLTRS